VTRITEELSQRRDHMIVVFTKKLRGQAPGPISARSASPRRSGKLGTIGAASKTTSIVDGRGWLRIPTASGFISCC